MAGARGRGSGEASSAGSGLGVRRGSSGAHHPEKDAPPAAPHRSLSSVKAAEDKTVLHKSIFNSHFTYLTFPENKFKTIKNLQK